MEISAKLTVLVLFIISHFGSFQFTTIQRTTYDDQGGISSLDNIYRYMARARPENAASVVDCPDCRRQKEMEALGSKQEIERQRIEIIKSQILKKLHMSAPPNITRPLGELPDPIAMGEEPVVRDERESREENSPSEIYVFPETVSDNCYTVLERPMVCFHFHFDTKMRHFDVEAAELWVYKLPDISDAPRGNQTFLLREIMNPNENTKKSGGHLAPTSITTTVREGWVKFPVKGAVYGWLRTRRHRTRSIEIICETCQNLPNESPVGVQSQHRPFFKIVMEKNIHSRQKRSAIMCGPTVTSCCLESLYVDFASIGWHWIRSPQGYYANYCRGSCRELIGANEWHVSRVLDQVAAQTTNDEVRGDLAACCAPTRATPLHLIYFDRDGSNSLMKRILHNMIINSCGCL